jgi:hypothetical protein
MIAEVAHTPQHRDEDGAGLRGGWVRVRWGCERATRVGGRTRARAHARDTCTTPRSSTARARARLVFVFVFVFVRVHVLALLQPLATGEPATTKKTRTPRRKRRRVRGRRDRKPSPVLAPVAGTRVAIIHLGCASPRTSSDATRRLGRTALERLPISSCSEWGLPCDQRYRWPGELLPRLFTLTVRLIRDSNPWNGGRFSAALSLGLPPPAVDWHPVLWSSDFPPAT